MTLRFAFSLTASTASFQDATTVEAYFPASLWYDFYTAKSFHSAGSFMTVDAPLDTIPLFVRGGSILPKKPPANTTTEM